MPWPMLFNRASPLCSWASSIDYLPFRFYSLLCTRRQIGDTDRKSRRREQLPWNLFSHTTILNPHQPATEERERERKGTTTRRNLLCLSSGNLNCCARRKILRRIFHFFFFSPIILYIMYHHLIYPFICLGTLPGQREAQHNHHQVLLQRNNINRPPPPPRYNYIQSLWLSRTCPKVPPQQYQSFRGF